MALNDTLHEAREHYTLMHRLPRECREAIENMSAAAFDVAALLAPNLRITSRMFEREMATVALMVDADGTDMRSRFGAHAITTVITRAQRERGLPVTVVVPF